MTRAPARHTDQPLAPTAERLLPDDLEAFLAGPRQLSPRTQSGYERDWMIFEGFCRSLGFEDLPAPVLAFEEFLAAALDGRLRSKGSGPLSPGRVTCILAAVRWKHAAHAVDYAFDQPDDAEYLKELVRGYGRAANEPTRNARPLTLEHFRALMSVELAGSPVEELVSAVILVMLDSDGWSLTAALQAILDSPQSDQNGGVLLTAPASGSLTLFCDHRERVAGIPHDCTACLVTKVTTLMGAGMLEEARDRPAEFKFRVKRRARRYPAFRWVASTEGTALVLSSADDMVQAGTRWAATGLASVSGGAQLERAKTALAFAFPLGLRLYSDLAAVARADVRSGPRGLSLAIWRSKGDQQGRGVMLPLAAARDQAVCAVRHHRRWIALLAASLGEVPGDGPLFCTIAASGQLYPDTALSGWHCWNRDFQMLVDLAGLSHRGYTPHSIRRGYVVAATEQGIPIEEQRRILRHRKIETTYAYHEHAQPLRAPQLAREAGAR